ncbi:MAG: arginase family protein [Thermoplasmata archaeon]|nr:arginase family protein [Thermoplasmata archaeon]
MPGAVPGAYKLGWALREQRIVARLWARDDGVVIPPRYRAEWDGHTLRNRQEIVGYTRRLAERVGSSLESESFLLLLGGDCSILLGPALALRRKGRYGLLFLDAHSDFRHPGNAPSVGAAAGEDLALVTGRGSPEVTNLDSLGPYVRDEDVIVLGFRPNDECAEELRALGIHAVDSVSVRERGPKVVAEEAIRRMEERTVQGFWIHLDADVLDSALMPAVDSPEPEGLTFEELSELLQGVIASPLAAGLDVTVFDPDLDADGTLAGRLCDALVAGLSPKHD